MEIIDKATGVAYNIDNYDGEIGAPDYMRDVSADDDNIRYNSETGCYEADMETIQWWLDYVDGMRDMTDKYEGVLAALTDLPEDDIDVADYYMSLADAISQAQGCDYEQHADVSLMAIEDWIKEHVSEDSQEALLQLLA